MRGTLILDRTETGAGGDKIFIFEHTDEDGDSRFLSFAEAQMPKVLVSSLRQGDIISAEWNENGLLSGTIDREATQKSSREAEDLLAKLFAKGKKK
jgi:hypothetical protein